MTHTELNQASTRSDKMFVAAYKLALQGQHRDSDEMLELAHEMRELEQQLADIAQHAPPSLAVLLVKAAMADFTDGDDLDGYLEGNLESIRLYAKHDHNLRKLLDAVFNPKPYKRMQFSLTEQEIEEARQEMKRRIESEPGRRSVTDPIITPQGIGVAARGFKTFLVNGECSMLRQCEVCKNKYETKLYSPVMGRIFWHCPHCNTIKEA